MTSDVYFRLGGKDELIQGLTFLPRKGDYVRFKGRVFEVEDIEFEVETEQSMMGHCMSESYLTKIIITLG